MEAMTVRVDLEAVRENLRIVRTLAGERTVMACVKGDAYGHGLLPVARCLAEAGVPWLTLGSPTEARALREAGITTPILLFPTIASRDLGPEVARGVTIGVQSAAEAEALARRADGRVAVFLKVDAGFGRVGAPLARAVTEAHGILHLAGVRLAGVFTHLPFSSGAGLAWARDRLKAFGAVADQIQAEAGGRLVVQALASTGLACGLDAPGTNAVCPGSMLYGVQPGWADDDGRPVAVAGLRPALVDVSTVVGSIRTIPAGERFGGGGARTAARSTTVGVLPLGHANSFLPRRPGQPASVGGRRVEILSVSLEHTVVDLTGAGHVDEGAPACLLARDPARGPSLDEVARAQGRAPVEVLVALSGKSRYEHVS